MRLNEDLFESANGINNLLIDAVNKKWESITNFNSIIVNLQEENYEDMVPVIEDILKDEHNHVGQLQQLIEMLTPVASEIESGKEQAENTLEDVVEETTPALTFDESLNESASFEEDIYTWLENHYGTTDWKNKFNAYINKIKSSSYNTIRLTTDINKAIKRFSKQSNVKPQVFMSALQESLRNMNNIERNKKLVNKDIANESLHEDIDENAGTYYVSYYEETPAYHPEEGGYYVAMCELIDSEEFDDLEAARQRIAELAEEDTVEKISDEFYLDRSRYVGCDRFYIIETERGSEEKGDTIYQ